MKKLVLSVALALASASSWAATPISIGTTPVGPLTFDTQPTSANGWTTLAVLPSSTTAIQTANDMDTQIQNVPASTIITELTSSTTYPPSANTIARWNNNATSGFFLQTRPTTTTMTLLMATLQNDSGMALPTLQIEYDFNALVSSDSTINESPELYGHRVYWSLNGTTWTVIPALSSIGTPGHLSATIDLGSWAPSTPLYIVWADDNGPSSDTAPQKEGAYTIDNLLFTPGATSFLTLVSPSESSTYAHGLPVVANVNGDSNVTSIQLYLDTDLSDGLPGTLVATVNSNTLTYTLAQQALGGPYGVYAVGTRADTSTVTTPTNTFYVSANLPPGIAITTPANGATTIQGLPLKVGVQVSDFDSAVSNVVVYFDSTVVATITNGMPGAAATATVYATNRPANAGSLVITAVATDVLGATGNASVTITVNPNTPPQITSGLVAQDGANLVSSLTVLTGTAVTNAVYANDTADAGGAISAVVFYDNNVVVWTNTATVANNVAVVSNSFVFILNNTAVGTHVVKAVVYDNSSQSSTSAAVTITVTNDPAYTILLANQSTWKYLDTINYPDATWITSAFDDSAWPSGVAELGYANGTGGSLDRCHPDFTVVRGGNDPSRPPSALFRRHFNVADRTAFTNLVVKALRDDGVAVYINGTLVFTNNMPADLPLTSYSAVNAGDDGTVYQTSTVPIDPLTVLQNGDNVVAVEIHQSSATSSDITFDLMILAQAGSVVATKPPITPRLVGGSLVITWPDTETGFQLKETSSLNPIDWQNSAHAPVQGGGLFTVTIPATNKVSFFQLSR